MSFIRTKKRARGPLRIPVGAGGGDQRAAVVQAYTQLQMSLQEGTVIGLNNIKPKRPN